MAPAGHSARGWCCWGPQFKEGVALPAWRVWAGPWAESLQGWGRGRGWGRSLCKTGGGAVGTAQPPALSSSRSYLNRGSRASLGGAGTYGCTDPSWQPQDPRPPSSRGRGWLLRPLLACGRVWPSRAQAVLSSPPEPVPRPVGACSSPRLGSHGGRRALRPSVWAALSHCISGGRAGGTHDLGAE